MRLRVFSGVAFCIIFSCGLSVRAIAQMSGSPIPDSGPTPGFEKYRPIPPDPPNPSSQTEERLPNGRTKQRWIRLERILTSWFFRMAQLSICTPPTKRL
jgi:hypothetical protein